MIRVTLTETELRLAALVGAERQIQNLAQGRVNAYGLDPEKSWHVHVEGAAGELAFAKWANKFWSGNLGNLKADDVGNIQVRTRSSHSFELYLHKSDPDNKIFVLLTGLAPTFAVRGWCWGAEGKRPEFWKDPARGRPAYFVPRARMHSMRELPERTPLVEQGAA